jgi:integrase
LTTPYILADIHRITGLFGTIFRLIEAHRNGIRATADCAGRQIGGFDVSERWDVSLGLLTDRHMTRTDAPRMIWQRARAAGIETELGCHSFRATGITVYLQNGGLLEHAQQMANHESARTTKLYDQRNNKVTLDEVEKIML